MKKSKYENINLDIKGVDPMVWVSIAQWEKLLEDIMMDYLINHRKAKLPMIVAKN